MKGHRGTLGGQIHCVGLLVVAAQPEGVDGYFETAAVAKLEAHWLSSHQLATRCRNAVAFKVDLYYFVAAVHKAVNAVEGEHSAYRQALAVERDAVVVEVAVAEAVAEGE